MKKKNAFIILNRDNVMLNCFNFGEFYKYLLIAHKKAEFSNVYSLCAFHFSKIKVLLLMLIYVSNHSHGSNPRF